MSKIDPIWTKYFVIKFWGRHSTKFCWCAPSPSLGKLCVRPSWIWQLLNVLPLGHSLLIRKCTKYYSTMWVGSMMLEYVNYISWAFERIENICLLFVHIGWTWKFGCKYTPDTICRVILFISGIFVGNIVHPNIIPWSYY